MDFRPYEAAPGISVIVLPDAPVYTYVAVSNDFIAASGMQKEDVIGKGHFEIFPKSPNDPNFTGEQNLKASFNYIIQNKGPHRIPFQRYDIPKPDGTFSQKYWDINNAPILSDTGEVLYIIHSAIDITDQILAEQKIASSKGIEKAYHLFMSAPVIIGILKGDDYVIELANEGLLEVWGRTTEVIGKPLTVAIPELAEQGFTTLLDQVRTTGEAFYAYEYPITLNRHGKEEVLYFDFVYKPIYENETDGKATGVVSVGHDVTEKLKAKKEVEESHREFQFVTDFIPQMIWLTKPDGYHYYYNKQWYDFTGLSYEETAGEGWNSVFHPDDQQRAWRLWRHSLATGEPYEIEYRCRRYDGEYRWVLGRALPLMSESGVILKWCGTCTDIHDKKLAAEVLKQKVQDRTKELEQANEALIRSNQELARSNQNLEEFAHAASHDMKEPLRKVLIFSERLKQSLATRINETEKDLFSRVENATQRMGLLVDDLLEFSHVSERPLEKEQVDLTNKFQKVLSDLELLIEEKNAKITVDPLPIVYGYRRQLQQLFHNLVGNALKYSKPDVSPQISITCKMVYGKEAAINILPEQLDQRFYLIEVNDNGIGFEQQHAEKIFGMFHRLHGQSEYPGTGVGLSIARKVVENHKGYIWAESQPGEGSTFLFMLPAE